MLGAIILPLIKLKRALEKLELGIIILSPCGHVVIFRLFTSIKACSDFWFASVKFFSEWPTADS